MDYRELETLPAEDLLRWALTTYQHAFAIVTSFQLEGMVLIDMASRLVDHFRVITVDTGRLPEETYTMIETVRARYGVHVEVAAPDPVELADLIHTHGPNCFYRSPELRLLCCQVRKVRPLERKLGTVQAWAVGLRRLQSETRATISKVELVAGRFKLSPLADWTDQQVEEYVQRHDVPRHPLYAKGYTSIGCEPCTRPTLPGEPKRAGRWWWESGVPKECGIHVLPNGTVTRLQSFGLVCAAEPGSAG